MKITEKQFLDMYSLLQEYAQTLFEENNLISDMTGHHILKLLREIQDQQNNTIEII